MKHTGLLYLNIFADCDILSSAVEIAYAKKANTGSNTIIGIFKQLENWCKVCHMLSPCVHVYYPEMYMYIVFESPKSIYIHI